MNLQSLVGLAMIAAAVGEGLRRNTAYWRTFLLVAILLPLMTLINGGALQFTLKYVASYAGLYLIPVVIERAGPKPLGHLRWSMGVSLAAIVVGLVLQLSGHIPWQSFDQFGHNYYGIPGLTPSNNIVGRLTGFYYHPLDLMRVLAWAFLVLISAWFAAWSRRPREFFILAPVLMLMQFVFLRTTHRTTMVYTLCAAALVGILRVPANKKKGGVLAFIAVIILTAMTWLGGIKLTKTNTPVGLEDMFNINHIVDTRAYTAPANTFNNINGTKLNMGRGRFRIWVGHLRWMVSTFSLRDWFFGTGRVPENVVDEEPHQQVIDFIQRYGLFGTILLFYGLYVAFASLKAPWHLKVCAVGTLLWYGLVTECLVMPTFPWCAALYMMLPRWFPRLARA